MPVRVSAQMHQGISHLHDTRSNNEDVTVAGRDVEWTSSFTFIMRPQRERVKVQVA